MVRIFYGNNDPFSGISTVPLVSRSQNTIYTKNRWGVIDSLDLNGTVTGKHCGFQDGDNPYHKNIYNNQLELISRFSKQFQPFGIVDNVSPSGVYGHKVTGVLVSGGVPFLFLEGSPTGVTGTYTRVYLSNSFVPQGVYTVVNTGEIVSSGIALKLDYAGSGAVTSYTHYNNNYPWAFTVGQNYYPYSYTGHMVYGSECSIVRDISFESSRMVGLSPYSISIDCYKSDTWSGTFGVLDPVDEFTFSENDDCSVSFTHTISARGFNYSAGNSNALENAKNFVYGRTGWSSQIIPEFIASPSKLVLQNISETVNRFNGEYAVTENWIYDPLDIYNASGILNYSTDLTSGNSDIQVSVKGNIIGGLNVDIANIRSKFSELNLYSLANNYYQRYYPSSLDSGYLGYSVTEDTTNRQLDFSVTFSNISRLDPYIEDSTTISEDFLAGKTCISVNAVIKSDFGCWEDRWNKINNYYSTFDIRDYAWSKWTGFGYTLPLESFAQQYSNSKNKSEPSVSFSATYCSLKEFLPNGLEKMEYSMSFSPSIPKYVPSPIVTGKGQYLIQRIGYDRRESFSVQGTALVKPNFSYSEGINDLKSRLNIICDKYFSRTNKVLETQSFTTGTSSFSKQISFSVAFTADKNEYAISPIFFEESNLDSNNFEDW